MKKRLFILLIFVSFCPLLLRGQAARIYTSDNGLPNSQINRIYQDDKGVIWLATEGGLIRFDGLDFEAFRQKTGYRFVLNRCDVNEDPSVGPFFYSDRDWKKPYYFHSNIHPNGGGLVLRYSVPEQKLYGRYSNR